MKKAIILLLSTIISSANAIDLLIDREGPEAYFRNFETRSQGIISAVVIGNRSTDLGLYKEGGDNMVNKGNLALKNAELANIRYVRFERILEANGKYDLRVTYGNDPKEMLTGIKGTDTCSK